MSNVLNDVTEIVDNVGEAVENVTHPQVETKIEGASILKLVVGLLFVVIVGGSFLKK